MDMWVLVVSTNGVNETVKVSFRREDLEVRVETWVRELREQRVQWQKYDHKRVVQSENGRHTYEIFKTKVRN